MESCFDPWPSEGIVVVIVMMTYKSRCDDENDDVIGSFWLRYLRRPSFPREDMADVSEYTSDWKVMITYGSYENVYIIVR